MSEASRTDIPSTDEQTEAWFLAQIAKPHIETTVLLDALRALREAGKATEAEQRAELLQDTLGERKKPLEAIDALMLRARWAAIDGRTGINWAEEASDVLGGEWEQKALVDESGFARPIPPVEALRRLRLLMSLREEVLVHDRTWGLGVVTRVDTFNKKIEIDFERRSGHQMSFSYAAESLHIVGHDHILMWKRKRGDDLRKLVQDDPAEVVRMALRSFGPLTVTQLQSTLTSGIVAEPDWKRFWDQARKKLKADPNVHLATTRTEPLRILEGAAAQSDQVFDSLARERDIGRIISTLEELAGRKSPPKLAETQRGVLADRLAFALKGATSQDLTTPARLLMAAETLGFVDKLDPARVPDFFQGRIFDETLKQLPSRPLRGFLRFLQTRNAEALHAMLLDRLNRFEIGVLNEAMLYLLETGLEQDAAVRFKQAFDARQPSLEMLSWLGRFPEKCSAWSLCAPGLMVSFMVEALEQDASGERLKAQNQLRERFAKPDWLKAVMGQLERADIEAMLLRIKESTGWPALDRASVLGQMVKINPELAPLLVARDEGVTAARGPVTSKRSFRERQQQLDRIVSVEIPKVAKDIALARSYGDLRENHEYKAAKENQTILFRRRDELMQELRRITPSDFRDFPSDKAGIATTVTVAYPDGRRETYHILGAWDGDTGRSIISSTSRMAEVLIGHTAGEQLMVPSEHGEVAATLESVQPLSAEILAWVSKED
ncbi:MAG TPA: GreA/GreB family elongation factor [Kiritimatiellia bacterium]|nr:GreA/GreB family elongation factor [Kiritimatiellia bacterium]